MFKALFASCLILKCAEAANILGVFAAASGSHYILNYQLMKGLVEAGHNVTMVSLTKASNPPKKGGIFTEIILDDIGEDFLKKINELDLYNTGDQNIIMMLITMTNLFAENTNKTLHHPKVHQLIQSGKKFDAVITEHFSNDGLKVFSYLFDCPMIVLSSIGPNCWLNPTVGNPQPISYVRHFAIGGNPAEEMTFLERTKNLLLHVADYLLTTYLVHPLHNDITHQAFPNAPDIYNLYTNVSLVLLNSHTSFYPPQPLVPNMIEIGGYHIETPKKLPKELQEFLDGARDGAIYFSMGSNLKSKNMSKEKKKIILNILRKLKQKVIWKFEEDLPDKPANVLIKKWLPQQDILAHPNIKLFITHGGLLSTTETIYHAVPILAIPVYGDQPSNADRAVFGGYGLRIGYNDKNFTEETVGNMIQEILNNPKYTENVRKISQIFHDRPLKPLDNAIYWIEYVIRHKFANHLRVGGIRLPAYKYFMIDVIIFLLLFILITIVSLKFVFKKLFSTLKNKRKQKTN